MGRRVGCLRRALLVCVALPGVLMAAGCGGSGGSGGGSVNAAGASAPSNAKVTLRMIDNETEGSYRTVMDTLIANYERAHPNVTIKRDTKAHNDYVASTRLVATGPTPPDIIQGNIGLSLDGPLVRAHALLPLDRYDAKYGWSKRFGTAGTQPFRFTSGAKSWGSGNLYGVSSKAEFIWVYYNKAKLQSLSLGVPKTFADFQSDLAKAKAGGQIPIMFGDTDQWPGGHIYYAIQNSLASPDAVRNWTLGHDGATFQTPPNVQAAQILTNWAKAGYFPEGYSGLSYDTSLAKFGKGQGVFMITGTWADQPLAQAMKSNVGAFLLPSNNGQVAAVTGGMADPWHISAKSKHPGQAADFINYLVSPEAARVFAAQDALPSTPLPARAFPKASLAPAADAAFARILKANAMVPYLDFATPTMDKTLFPAVQELLGSKISPQDFVKQVQGNWSSGRKIA